MSHGDPHFVSTTGETLIARTTTLAEMKQLLAEIFDAGEREDVAVWDVAGDGRARVVLLLTSDGRTLEMDGAALTWTKQRMP
jgi:hypothetical protein